MMCLKMTTKATRLGMLAALLAGCGAADPEPTVEAESIELGPYAVLYDCVEADFSEVHPLSGAGYSPETGIVGTAQDKYFVTTTMLYWKPGKKDDFYSMGGRVMAQVDSSDGVIAWALGTDETCRVARSISVWRSEEDMYAFAVSGAHGEATTKINDLSFTGRAVRWWAQPEELGQLHWETARTKLLEIPESPVYE
jgi:heme-degrading monooxygenase HmoA